MSIPIQNLNAQWLKDTYFFGIPLTDMDGNTIQDSVLEFYIKRGIKQMEKELDIVIEPQTFTERYDFYLDQWRGWAYFRLKHRPIISVQSFKVKFGDQPVFDVPLEWLRIESNAGQIHLFPQLGQFGGTLAIDKAYTLAPILLAVRFAPQLFEITYTAGMNEVEEDLADAIGMIAAIQVFNIFGDLVIGAGIASLSISVDGISQSIGTTSSAENAAYSARIIMYKRELYGHGEGKPGLLNALKNKWRGITMGLI